MMRAKQEHWILPERENAAATFHSILLDGGIPNHLFSVKYDQFNLIAHVLIGRKVRHYHALLCDRPHVTYIAEKIVADWTAAR